MTLYLDRHLQMWVNVQRRRHCCGEIVNYRTGSGCGKAVDRREQPFSRFEPVGFGCLRICLFSVSFHPFRPVLFIYKMSPLSLWHGIPSVAGSNLNPDCFINRFSAALEI